MDPAPGPAADEPGGRHQADDGTTGNVYELRIYRTVLGGAQQYGKNFKEVQAAREKYSPIWGAWTGEFPQPNEWIHLWRYKNLEERFKARGDAMKDPAWQAYLAKGPAKLAGDAFDPADADELFAAEVGIGDCHSPEAKRREGVYGDQ